MSRRQDTYPGRGTVAIGLMAASGGLLLGACTATGDGNSAPTGSRVTRSAIPTTPVEAPGVPRTNRIWGLRPNQVPFPGRIALPNPGDVTPCSPYGQDNPLPIVRRRVGGKALTLVIVDARDSYPPNCNPKTDTGAGMYSAPTLKSAPEQIDGTPHLRDGQVADVRAWAFGQIACNTAHDPGGTEIWLKLSKTADGPAAWTSMDNTDNSFNVPQLNADHIPQELYPGIPNTSQGDCPGL